MVSELLYVRLRRSTGFISHLKGAVVFRKTQAIGLALVPAALVGSLIAAAPAGASSISSRIAATENGYLGTAFGSLVNSTVVNSGRSALSSLGCTSQAGVTHSNSVASVGASGLASTGVVTTSVQSKGTGSGPATVSTTTVAGVSLLGGLVGATALKSVSTTSLNTTTGKYSTSASGTTFTGLTVEGLPIVVSPAANTKLSLPGVGYVELNQQSSKIGKSQASLRVIAIHVVVTISTPLAPVGTNIEIGFASSGLAGAVQGLLTGLAYGAHANVGNHVTVGSLFPEGLSCTGTHGTTVTNPGGSLNIPGIASGGAVVDSVSGSTAKPDAHASSTIANLNLLSSLIKAGTIKADVTAKGNPPSYTDNSSFAGLSVSGFPGLGDSVKPNTKLSLAGIGTLWLHRVQKFKHEIQVTMIQVDVTASGNPLGLSVGTKINIGYAKAGIA